MALIILTQHLGHANTLRFLSLNQSAEVDDKVSLKPGLQTQKYGKITLPYASLCTLQIGIYQSNVYALRVHPTLVLFVIDK